MKSYYAIDLYEDLSVVLLDSSHTYSIESQVEFLKACLSFRKDRTHLFALYHFPAYGIMKGGLNSPISKSMRKHWVPWFDQYGLDAAFENDHHVYKRSKLLKGDKINRDDTLYIGDGAWGVSTRKPGKKSIGMWKNSNQPAMSLKLKSKTIYAFTVRSIMIKKFLTSLWTTGQADNNTAQVWGPSGRIKLIIPIQHIAKIFG